MPLSSKLLPDNVRRCIAPETRAKEPDLRTAQEHAEKHEAKAEKEMHTQFSNWCRVNDLFVIHSRTDKKTTQRKGMPDFIVCKGDHAEQNLTLPPERARVCAVEFKHGRGQLRPEQIEVATELFRLGIPFLCTYSVAEAILWTKETLEK